MADKKKMAEVRKRMTSAEKYPYDGPKALKDSGKQAKETITTRKSGDVKAWADSEEKYVSGLKGGPLEPGDYVKAGERKKWEASATQKGYGYQRQIDDETGDELIRRGVLAGDAQRKRLKRLYGAK